MPRNPGNRYIIRRWYGTSFVYFCGWNAALDAARWDHTKTYAWHFQNRRLAQREARRLEGEVVIGEAR